MAWLQVNVSTDGADSAAIETQLLALGALSVTFTDAADQPVLEPDPNTHPIWDRVIVTGLFPGEIEPTDILLKLTAAGISPAAVSSAELDDQQWETVWMDQYQPMQFGQRLWIYPSHIEPPVGDGHTIIRLDPGLAFGSGTHPTTRLCLEWIDQTELAGKTVIDYGCGSGILAIACALKGAGTVYAIDHDPQALQATGENARLNGVAGQLIISDPDSARCEPVDVLLANILAGPLIELSLEFCRLTRPSGYIVLSGVLNTQLTELKIAYSKLARLEGHASCEDWARLVLRKD